MSGSEKDIPEQSPLDSYHKDKASMPDDAELVFRSDEDGRENVTFPLISVFLPAVMLMKHR